MSYKEHVICRLLLLRAQYISVYSHLRFHSHFQLRTGNPFHSCIHLGEVRRDFSPSHAEQMCHQLHSPDSVDTWLRESTCAVLTAIIHSIQ